MKVVMKKVCAIALVVCSSHVSVSAVFFKKKKLSSELSTTRAPEYATLLAAVEANDLNGVLKFLAVRSGTVDVDAETNGTGQTALMVAAAHNNPDMVRVLLAHGANPWLRDNAGRTALALAKQGVINPEVVELLREAIKPKQVMQDLLEQ